jgi:hypothetical protein
MPARFLAVVISDTIFQIQDIPPEDRNVVGLSNSDYE